MIFLEGTLKKRDYRALMADVEQRVFGCGRESDGTFATKNDCQDDGKGGAGEQPPARDNSWRDQDDDVTFTAKEMKQSSPITGGEKIKSLTISEPKQVSAAMKDFGVSDLDSLVKLGGGAIRDSAIGITADGAGTEDSSINITINAPVDPSDPGSPKAKASIGLLRGFGDGETVVDYSDFTPGGLSISDGSKDGENTSRRLRVGSILKERMLESLIEAEKVGITKAATMAVGSKGDPYVKGYRLWPQFGFDAKVPSDLVDKIPDEILLKAAGVAIPPPSASRIPHATVIRGLRRQVKGVTVQQLMKFREGERWWTDNGRSVEMTLDFQDKKSPGYKQFVEEQKKLPALRRRNEGRSWYPIDDFERRSCDGSDKDESGKFTTGNDCGGESGGGSSPRPLSRAKREKWRESEEGYLAFDSSQMKQGSPLIGGEKVRELTISQPQRVAKALDKIGLKDLDTAVKIGGGAIRDSEIIVKSYGTENISVRISSPVDPSDPEGGSVITSVDIWDYGEGKEVHYGGLNTPSRVSDPSRLDAGSRDKTRLRIASLMQERMIESLLSAQKAGIDRASTYAAGDGQDGMYQGYRLWPQFGFDAKLDLNQYPVPAEIVLSSFKKKAPESADEAAKQAKKLTSKGFTLQQLISTREGKKWWDDNGSSLDMYLDFKDKKSLGYKKLARLKKVLPKLKDRNVAEGRTLLGWLIEEVSRRSMSLVGFLGGLNRAIERRDCGPSDKESDGTFAPGNDCQEDAGEGGSSVATVARKAKERNVDVMLAGGKRVAVMDQESRQRAVDDFKANPKPPGSAAGSSTDLWDRAIVTRGEGKQQKGGSVSEGKIESTDPVFTADDLRQSGRFVAHEAVGVYLSNRHEEERRKTGATGPGSIIDLDDQELPESQMQYLVDALTEDAIHAYDVLGVDSGFYSTDLADTMRQMTQRYPEFEADDNARFIFTTLLAITSTGQGPDANLRDADDLYRMFREHGTVVPTEYGGGARDVTASLRMFQGLLDSFGKDRTRRLLSGYTTAGNIEKAFEKLAGKSQAEAWRERTGSSAWSMPVGKGGSDKKMVSGERVDEVVPVAAILGPKIGSFFANLSGRHEFLTMDRWLMRSVGRVTGDLVTRTAPKQAKERANTILKALESGKWSRDKLFGIDKTHGVTKADLVRSLKIQARTGVIEENGAAFIWATAAERAYGKTPRLRADGSKPGGYGKHPDPEIAALHSAGNSMFKSLINEQQDPRTGTARRNIREVFRRVQSEIEKKTGRKADIDEIQAALWQYEKRLWKHLGAKTNITDNSLFSAAAAGVISGRLARSESNDKAKPFKPASRRDATPAANQVEDDGEFDTNHFDAEQSAWDSSFADLDIDILELLKLLEEDVEERRNFAALDAVIEVRSADCGRDDGGRFGPKNQCQDDGAGGSGGEEQPTPSWARDIEHSMKKSRGYDDPANKQAWLNLSGTFYPVSGDHGEFAAKHGVEGGGEDLLDAGWLRVAGVSGDTLFVGNSSGKPPKQSQVSALRDFAISTGSIGRVVFDDGRSRRGRVIWQKEESRSADCGRDDGGKFGDGNTCAGSKDAGLSNSKGESFRGVRRKTDKTQTKVARKLYQMRVKEKQLKALVRDLGGKVSNTFVEIDSTRGDEGVNVFVRDRDNNETHYIHIGYYGATIYPTDRASSPETSRIQAAAKASLPKTIDDRLWGGGSDYPVYVVNDPAEAAKQWGGKSAKQRLKKERRSADCGRTEDGKFGPKNQCQDDGKGGGAATAQKPKSPLDTNENKSWTAASGDEPFEGASRYKEVSASGGKKVAESLEKTGLSPGEALAATGAPERSEVWMRPAPEFAREFPGSDTPPVMVNFEADVAGVRRGLSGSSVIGSANGEKVVYHSVFEVFPEVQADAGKRHAAARAFYRTMVSSIENARKSGVAEIRFNAAGKSGDKGDKSAFRGYTIWPRMGFDAKLPDRIRAKLPESLSHATSLLDLHATREGTKWWAENGEDIDVSFRVADRSSPQSKIMDRFIQHFMKERREMPLGAGDDWLSPEDLLRLDEMWQEVWDEGDLDDYEYVEQRSADCGRTEDGRFGPKNECQEEGAGSGSEPKKMLQASTRKEAAAYASMLPGTAEEDISKAVKKTRGPDRFGVVGSAARNLPVGDAKATKDYSESTIREVGGFQAKFAEDVAKRLAQTVLDAESSRFPSMAARGARDNAAAAIASIISAAEEMPEIRSERLRASTAEEIARMFHSDDPSTDIEIHRQQASGTGALYSTQDDAITFNTDGASQMLSSLIANDSMRKGSKGFSTSQVGHALVHEVGHRIHLQAIRKSLGIPINTRATNEQMAEITFDLNSRVAQAQAYIRSRPETAQDIRNLSLYAATSPMETVAEYYVGVKIGKVKRTETLDRVVEILGFPVGELSPAKKQKARNS